MNSWIRLRRAYTLMIPKHLEWPANGKEKIIKFSWVKLKGLVNSTKGEVISTKSSLTTKMTSLWRIENLEYCITTAHFLEAPKEVPKVSLQYRNRFRHKYLRTHWMRQVWGNPVILMKSIRLCKDFLKFREKLFLSHLRIRQGSIMRLSGIKESTNWQCEIKALGSHQEVKSKRPLQRPVKLLQWQLLKTRQSHL